MLKVTPSNQSCGAAATGIDLSQSLSDDQVGEIRATWLEHQVLAFPEQQLTDDDLERFTQHFGNFGVDPFIAPVEGRKHILAIARAADETAPIFAENWHTDWSFQKNPPAGTCLYGIVIPPEGGDTLFANQVQVLEEMPDQLRARLEGKMAVHSARIPYGNDGTYGDGDTDKRAMVFLTSDDAKAEQLHPIIREHPETGKQAIFGTVGYTVGIADMDQSEAEALLMELYAWQTQERFQYRHKWQEKMLVMWDNRSVLHMATSGYDGHARLLHRTTIASA